MDKSPPKTWFDGLQSLRGILFLLVFVSHSGAFFQTAGAYGAMAVSAFFALSGFLCGCRCTETNDTLLMQCLNSLWRRWKRFWPVYAATLPAAALLNPCGAGDFLKSLFLVQSYFGDAQTAQCLNWPAWFLSSILLSYLFSPLLVRVLRGLGRHVPWAILLLWAVELCWAWFWRGTKAAVADPGYYWVYVCPLARLVDFAMGVALGQCYVRCHGRDGDGATRSSVFLECVAAGVAILSMLCFDRVPVSFIGSAFWAPASVALVWVFACREGPLTRSCCSGWLMWMGHRSLELYIVHRMILLFVSKVAVTAPATWALSFLATCVVAELLASADAVARARIVQCLPSLGKGVV